MSLTNSSTKTLLFILLAIISTAFSRQIENNEIMIGYAFVDPSMESIGVEVGEDGRFYQITLPRNITPKDFPNIKPISSCEEFKKLFSHITQDKTFSHIELRINIDFLKSSLTDVLATWIKWSDEAKVPYRICLETSKREPLQVIRCYQRIVEGTKRYIIDDWNKIKVPTTLTNDDKYNTETLDGIEKEVQKTIKNGTYFSTLIIIDANLLNKGDYHQFYSLIKILNENPNTDKFFYQIVIKMKKEDKSSEGTKGVQ